MISHRHGQWNVDADHAHQDIVGEIAGGFAVAGVDAGAVAVDVVVDQIHRLLHGLHAYYLQHRAEDFFLITHHVGGNVIDQRAAEVEAVFIAGHAGVTAVHHDGGALLFGAGNVTFHFGFVRGSNQRAEMVGFVGKRADFHGFHALFDTGHHAFGDFVAYGHRHRQGHTALTGRTECRAQQGINHIVQIGIGQHDGMVFRTAERLAALAVGGGGGVDVFGNRGGADEADGLHTAVGQQGIHRLFAAVNHV